MRSRRNSKMARYATTYRPSIYCADLPTGMQWKKPENWAALNPLAPSAITPQSGPETRIETHSSSSLTRSTAIARH